MIQPNPRSPGALAVTLDARIRTLVSREREALVELLLELAELDRSQLYCELGESSFFGYCTNVLKLSNGSAFRRTTAARLLRKYPAIGPLLAQGQLNLSSLCALKDVLVDTN